MQTVSGWTYNTYFESWDTLPAVCEEIKAVGLKHKRKKDFYYYNVPCAFDIETTSFYLGNEKASTMYIWMVGLNGHCYYGRTWDEFTEFINRVVIMLELSTKKRLLVYVHNLGFEFEYICRRFKYASVFALDTHKPVYALTTHGIEFRCSYILCNYSLSNVAKNLTKYKVKKMVGDLDYTKPRHSNTPLTPQEMRYCLYDIIVVMCYIQEEIENNRNDITLLVLTNTGRVRRYCKNSCEKGKYAYYNHRQLMAGLTMDKDEFIMLHQAFTGGFTHASALISGIVLDDVTSFDFCSAYPAMLIAKQYPMSKGEKIRIKDSDHFNHLIKYYCCLFEIELTNIRPRLWQEHPISRYKCTVCENGLVDNGRVVSADKIRMVITEQDYLTFKDFYLWDTIRIGSFYRYRKNYLPTNLVKAILKLYNDKTALKDVEGKEVEYLLSKGMLNSTYGMCVTNPCRDDITVLNGEWTTAPADVETKIDEYNNAKNRFLFYPWGVWCTAHARRSLFTGIKAVGNDFVYADTDSIKITNADEHTEYFKRYNEHILYELTKALNRHNIPIDHIKPVNQKGKETPLGIWEREYTADKFKTIGAKRYLYQIGNEYHLTMAGVGKVSALEYLKTKDNVFDAFADELYIPADHTGTNIHAYIEYAQDGNITDYLGNTAEFHELGGVHIEPTDYHLSITEEYRNILLNIKEWAKI